MTQTRESATPEQATEAIGIGEFLLAPGAVRLREDHLNGPPLPNETRLQQVERPVFTTYRETVNPASL